MDIIVRTETMSGKMFVLGISSFTQMVEQFKGIVSTGQPT